MAPEILALECSMSRPGIKISLRRHRSIFWKLFFITFSRRLEVSLLLFGERGVVYNSNGSRAANSVKQISGLSKCQIYNATVWRDTVSRGSLGTAKSE